jgi:hypothetical protein
MKCVPFASFVRRFNCRLVCGRVLLSTGLVMLIGVGSAAADSAVQYAQSAAEVPLPTTTSGNDWVFNATACSTTDFCVSVGDYDDTSYSGDTYPLYVPFSGGVAGQDESVALPANVDSSSPDASLAGVSCQSGDVCEAFGSYRDQSGDVDPMVVQIALGMPATAVELTLPTRPADMGVALDAISCPPSGTC